MRRRLLALSLLLAFAACAELGGAETDINFLSRADGFARAPVGFGGQSGGSAVQGGAGAPQVLVVSEAQSGPFETLVTPTFVDPEAAAVVDQPFPGPTAAPGAIGAVAVEALLDGAPVQAVLILSTEGAALQHFDEETQAWGFTRLLQSSVLDAVAYPDFSGAVAANTSRRQVFELELDSGAGVFGTPVVIASTDLGFGRPLSAWSAGPTGDIYVVSVDEADAARLERWDRTAETLALVEQLPDGARRFRSDGGLAAVSSETTASLRVLNLMAGSATAGDPGPSGTTLTAGDGSIGIDVKAFGDVVGVISTGLRDDTWWVHWFEKPEGPGAPVLLETAGPMSLPEGIVAPAHAGFLTLEGTADQTTVDVAITAQDNLVIVRGIEIPR